MNSELNFKEAISSFISLHSTHVLISLHIWKSKFWIMNTVVTYHSWTKRVLDRATTKKEEKKKEFSNSVIFWDFFFFGGERWCVNKIYMKNDRPGEIIHQTTRGLTFCPSGVGFGWFRAGASGQTDPEKRGESDLISSIVVGCLSAILSSF